MRYASPAVDVLLGPMDAPAAVECGRYADAAGPGLDAPGQGITVWLGPRPDMAELAADLLRTTGRIGVGLWSVVHDDGELCLFLDAMRRLSAAHAKRVHCGVELPNGDIGFEPDSLTVYRLSAAPTDRLPPHFSGQVLLHVTRSGLSPLVARSRSTNNYSTGILLPISYGGDTASLVALRRYVADVFNRYPELSFADPYGNLGPAVRADPLTDLPDRLVRDRGVVSDQALGDWMVQATELGLDRLVLAPVPRADATPVPIHRHAIDLAAQLTAVALTGR